MECRDKNGNKDFLRYENSFYYNCHKSKKKLKNGFGKIMFTHIRFNVYRC